MPVKDVGFGWMGGDIGRRVGGDGGIFAGELEEIRNLSEGIDERVEGKMGGYSFVGCSGGHGGAAGNGEI